MGVQTGTLSIASTVQSASPTSGQTVTMEQGGNNTTLWLTPAGPLASLTVSLPGEAVSWMGQLCSVGTSQPITDLTVNNATTIFNNVTTLSAGDLYAFKKVAPNTWSRYAL